MQMQRKLPEREQSAITVEVVPPAGPEARPILNALEAIADLPLNAPCMARPRSQN
jgi:hypothetical protein